MERDELEGGTKRCDSDGEHEEGAPDAVSRRSPAPRQADGEDDRQRLDRFHRTSQEDGDE